jgi:hypothetical protein
MEFRYFALLGVVGCGGAVGVTASSDSGLDAKTTDSDTQRLDAGMGDRGDAAVPITVLASKQSPQFLAVDTTSVYWVDLPGGQPGSTILKCAIAGCNDQPTTLWSGPGVNVVTIAVEQDAVWWPETTGLNTLNSTILSCAVGGCSGSPSVLVNLPNQEIYAFAADATDAYWLGNVQFCALTGCGGMPAALHATTYVSDGALAIGNGAVYWWTWVSFKHARPRVAAAAPPCLPWPAKHRRLSQWTRATSTGLTQASVSPVGYPAP